MQQPSIISYFWFWILIIGILLILLAALLHLGLKKNTGWVWWIFIAGAVLAVLGIILAIVSYYNTKCVVVQPSPITEDFGCNNFSPETSVNESYIPLSSEAPVQSPVYSPMGTPSRSTLNMLQTQRGFATSSSELSRLAPPSLN